MIPEPAQPSPSTSGPGRAARTESGTSNAVSLQVDYPDRQLDRWSTALRPIVALPALLLLAVLGSGGTSFGPSIVVSGGGLLVLPTIAMIVSRRKYPRWFFEFNRELVRFSARVGAFLALMDDRYPSTDEEQAVHVRIDPPDVPRDLNRWLPLVKWFLAIPHYVALLVLWIGAVFAVLFAWVNVVLGRRYPRGAFDYVVAVANWQLRVSAYAFLLVTDVYPPFRLHPETADGVAPHRPAA